MTAGVIVAGGDSSRFGPGDKALAPIAGVPMIRRVVDRAVPLVDRIVVNARREQRSALSAALSDVSRPVEFAIDEEAGAGPVAGIETALDALDDGDALVLACDLPLLRTDVLSALLDRLDLAAASSPDCVLPLVDGYPEPLCGAYAIEGLRSAIEVLGTARDRAVNELLEHLCVSTVPQRRLPGGPRVYESVNTPEELRTVRRIVRDRGRSHPASIHSNE